MVNEIWQKEEQKFLTAINGVQIPNAELDNVEFIEIKKEADLNKIPNGGGCYWIWTDEPVLHTLHKNKTPVSLGDGEIIYNGIAKDDVKGRVKHHLFGEVDAGWSGISLDVYFGNTTSRRKKGLSEKGKVPYIKEKKILKRGSKKSGLKKGDEIEIFKPIRKKADFMQINLSNGEREKLLKADNNKIYFRNGINLTEEKHKNHRFKVYYITRLSSLYLDFIEKKWREDNGLPKLCSYSSGR